jgi:membrane protease YdiL (CAAX protease family)
MPTGIFLNSKKRLHNAWWIAIFFALLAALLLPALLVSIEMHHELSVWEQAGIILIATLIVQFLRKKSISEVTGETNARALRDLGVGIALGFLLMAAPATMLWCGGFAHFSLAPLQAERILAAVVLMAGVAIAEELLFRGVIFQRLVAAMGEWPAQIAIGLLFVLTHLGNPGMDGATQLWAGLNIFLASVLFGKAFLRSKGLALPIGLHFMANVTQGVVLGFGVSGNDTASLLSSQFTIDAPWLTGGAFGLEASLPGLITLSLMLAYFVFSTDLRQDSGWSIENEN